MIRLRARAVSEDVSVGEVVRRAVETYLARPHSPRRPGAREKVDLVNLLQKNYHLPKSLARAYLGCGRVKVNGNTTTDFEIATPKGGRVDVEVQ